VADSEGRRRPQVIIGVGGLVASRKSGITERARSGLVLASSRPCTLPQRLDELRRSGKTVIDVSSPRIEKFDQPAGAAGRGRAGFGPS